MLAAANIVQNMRKGASSMASKAKEGFSRLGRQLTEQISGQRLGEAHCACLSIKPNE